MTIFDLIHQIEQICPRAKSKHNEIFAEIKRFVHSQKLFAWHMILLNFGHASFISYFRHPEWTWKNPKTWFRAIMFHFGYAPIGSFLNWHNEFERHAKGKQETHEQWANYEKCLEWVKEYGQQATEQQEPGRLI